ncbi:MAG: SRPBCC family protein [Candidatus Limnocylindrales bacterium]
MIIEQQVTIPASIERVWAFMLDIPAMSTCVPGVETVELQSPGVYAGILGVRVGPVSVRLEGRVTIAEQDDQGRLARLLIEATDRRIRGAVNARTTMQLRALDGGQTELRLHTDAAILGRLGQFGQAVMRKKADQVMAEFAANVRRRLAAA